jgi:hypothetical protein
MKVCQVIALPLYHTIWRLCQRSKGKVHSRRVPWQALLFWLATGRPAARNIGTFERHEDNSSGGSRTGSRPAFAGRAWLAR